MNNKSLLLATILVGAAYSWAVCPPALASAEPDTVPISNNIPVVDTIKVSLQAKSDALKGKPTYNSLTHSLNISSGIYSQNEAQKVSALVETIKASNLKEKSGVLSSNAEGLNLKKILKSTKKVEENPVSVETSGAHQYSYNEGNNSYTIYYDDQGDVLRVTITVDGVLRGDKLYDELATDDKQYFTKQLEEHLHWYVLTDRAGQSVRLYYDVNGQLTKYVEYDENGNITDEFGRENLSSVNIEMMQFEVDIKLSQEGFYPNIKTKYNDIDVKVFYNKEQQIISIIAIDEDGIESDPCHFVSLTNDQQEYFKEQLDKALNQQEEFDRE